MAFKNGNNKTTNGGRSTIINPLEMESLTTISNANNKKDDNVILRPSAFGGGGGESKLSRQIDSFIALIRMYIQLYPKLSAVVGTLMGILMIKILFFRHSGDIKYVVPHLDGHIGDLQSKYDLEAAKIDHWCLHGGNDDCHCDDPTDPLDKGDLIGWMELHKANKHLAKAAVAAASSSTSSYYDRVRNSMLDVVFYGDGTIEAYNGKGLKGQEPLLANATATKELFQSYFHKENGGAVEGIALGIAGDTTANLLWRILNGEMPASLNAKVWWLLVGTNDLVVGECSEEAIILGILRLAEEIYVNRPGTVIVIQGLLPRTPYPDGSLTSSKKTRKSKIPRTHTTHIKATYYKPDQYPLWPSIQLINEELERFCAKHEHFVYFDAASIFLGSEGNKHYQSSEMKILENLMPDYAHLSDLGYEIMTKVIAQEVNRIIYEDDEDNHKTGPE